MSESCICVLGLQKIYSKGCKAVDLTWPNAGVVLAPKAEDDVTPKAGVVEPKPKPPGWAGVVLLPNIEGVDAGPNAGDDCTPNAGALGWPKGALACVCPKSPPEGCPKLPPGDPVPVFPLHPACIPDRRIGIFK